MRYTKISLFIKKTTLVLFVMLLGFSQISQAVTCTTTAPGVWDCGVPANNDNLIVNHAVTIAGNFDTNGTITINAEGDLTTTGRIRLNTTGSLLVNSGGSLTVGTSLDKLIPLL